MSKSTSWHKWFRARLDPYSHWTFLEYNSVQLRFPAPGIGHSLFLLIPVLRKGYVLAEKVVTQPKRGGIPDGDILTCTQDLSEDVEHRNIQGPPAIYP